MRLATKLILANSAGLLLLGILAGWSVWAVGRVVEVNDKLATRAAPALRLEEELLESAHALHRLERRHDLLGDVVYASVWQARAERMLERVDALRPLLTLPAEEQRWLALSEILDAYLRSFGTPDAPLLASRLVDSLERLSAVTAGSLAEAQRHAASMDRAARRSVLLVLPAGLLAVLAGTVFFTRRMTRDLRRLSDASGEVARGTFVGQLPVERGDEVGELAIAFRAMADRLVEADHAKENFFASVSHEFRSPLTAIREAASLLQDGVAGALEPRQRRLVEIVDGSCDRLLGLVNRILVIGKRREELRSMDHRTVDMGRVVEQACRDLQPQASARRLELQYEAEPGALVRGDEEQLAEVLVNLLGNAIKFSNEGEPVHVALSRRGHQIEMAVEDHGVGIPHEAIPHIFDRYWRAAPAHDEGGLGLAIVKSIVEAHGGMVAAMSEPGRETRFTVHLPAAEVAA